MKKVILTVGMFLLFLAARAQTCPTPTNSGAFITLDQTYQLGSYSDGKTNIGLCYQF